MQREVIRPMVGAPVVVKLDQADGVQREGKYGVDYQYVCNDDSAIMWLPAEGRDALLRANAQAGDSVEIVKSKRGKDFFFSARIVGDGYEAPRSREVATIPASRYYQPGVNGGNGVNGHSNGQNGNAYSDPKAAAPDSTLLAQCLRIAIDAIVEATAYGKQRGVQLAFNEEDIRSCAMTAYINMTKGGRA